MSFDTRDDEIGERDTDEFRIDFLEIKLRDLEIRYEELEVNWQSNLDRLAMKKVELFVAKEVRAFTEDMLDRKREIIVEERKKLDDLHWRVWDGERKICNEINKCLDDNNSIDFLNEYPRVLKSGKYAFTAAQESDEEIRKAIEDNPAIKQLSLEIAELETEVEKTEDNCWQETLERVSRELEEYKRLYPANNSDETERLIEALECSHRGRMSVETEIAEIEYTRQAKVYPSKENIRECKKLVYTPRVKMEKDDIFNVRLSNDERWLEPTPDVKPFNNLPTKVAKKRDEKSKAKKWYENYACELAVSQRESDVKSHNITVSQCDIAVVPKPETVVEPSSSVQKCSESDLQQNGKMYSQAKGKGTRGKIKLSSKNKVKTASEPRHSELSTRSRFFEIEDGSPEPEISSPFIYPRPKRNFDQANEPSNSKVGLLLRIPKPKRKFESLVATPSTFLRSAAETTIDNNSVQSNYTEAGTTSYAAAPDKLKNNPKLKGNFTPKKPSNIQKYLTVRQTKIDEFHEFMLSKINQ